MKQWYDNPDDAAREDKRQTAYGETILSYKGKPMKLAIVKRYNRDPVIVFPTAPAIVIRRATTREVDSVKRWQAYQPKGR